MQQGQSDAQLQVWGWATPRPGMSLDALIEHMAEIGNTVLEVDREGNRLKLLDLSQDLSPEQTQRLTQQLTNEGAAHV